MLQTNNRQNCKRIIRVSGKRQITIPLKFFQSLGLTDQVECSLEEGALVIRPLKQDENSFSVEILKDLVAQGLTGDALVQKFSEASQQVKEAVRSLFDEADEIAAGKCPSSDMDDIFGEDGDV